MVLAARVSQEEHDRFVASLRHGETISGRLRVLLGFDPVKADTRPVHLTTAQADAIDRARIAYRGIAGRWPEEDE